MGLEISIARSGLEDAPVREYKGVTSNGGNRKGKGKAACKGKQGKDNTGAMPETQIA